MSTQAVQEVVTAAGTTAAALRESFRFAAAHRVGGVVELSGQTGHLPDLTLPVELAAEVDAAFANATAVLDAAGLTWSQVYAVRSYHVVEAGAASISEESIGAVMAAMAARFSDHLPVWTAVAVPALAFPGMRVEIELKAAAA